MENRFEHIDTIIARFLAGEAHEQEIRLLEEWKAVSDENLKIFENYSKIFSHSSSVQNNLKVDTEAAWLKVKKAISNEGSSRIIPISNQRSRTAWLRIAAIIVLLAGLIFSIYILKPDGESQLVQINSGDSIKTEKLPDGSTITLNRKSTIAFAGDRFSKKRIVKLHGEAFFDVVHDASKPFVVETGDLSIQDIGTSFNVKSAEGEDCIIVSVVSGEVKVSSLNNESLFLAAGDEARYYPSTHSFEKSDAISSNIASYANRIFIFENTELITVMKVLNEVYSIKLKTENESINSCRITATFDDESIEEISEVIAETLGLNIKKENNSIIFTGNACVQ